MSFKYTEKIFTELQFIEGNQPIEINESIIYGFLHDWAGRHRPIHLATRPNHWGARPSQSE
jgi:hypothetical protein